MNNKEANMNKKIDNLDNSNNSDSSDSSNNSCNQLKKFGIDQKDLIKFKNATRDMHTHYYYPKENKIYSYFLRKKIWTDSSNNVLLYNFYSNEIDEINKSAKSAKKTKSKISNNADDVETADNADDVLYRINMEPVNGSIYHYDVVNDKVLKFISITKPFKVFNELKETFKNEIEHIKKLAKTNENPILELSKNDLDKKRLCYHYFTKKIYSCARIKCNKIPDYSEEYEKYSDKIMQYEEKIKKLSRSTKSTKSNKSNKSTKSNDVINDIINKHEDNKNDKCDNALIETKGQNVSKYKLKAKLNYKYVEDSDNDDTNVLAELEK